ncbi:13485_t:CDS:1, partial [Cetraspora pellucida]
YQRVITPKARASALVPFKCKQLHKEIVRKNNYTQKGHVTKSKRRKAEKASNSLQTMALTPDENSLYKIWDTESNNLLTANWADALEAELSKVAPLLSTTPTNGENNVFNSLKNSSVVTTEISRRNSTVIENRSSEQFMFNLPEYNNESYNSAET